MNIQYLQYVREQLMVATADLSGATKGQLVSFAENAMFTATPRSRSRVKVITGDERQYSLDADYSGKYSPNGWATKAIEAYEQHEADAIVIETNQGGDMAEDTLRNAGFGGRIIRVHASKGKYARAEPISALYAQGRVAHRGSLYEIENQFMEYVPSTAKKSPDRLDAAVYALTELSEPQSTGMLVRSR
ncbi:bacteriophage antitermination protein Q [Escherichia coli]|nr:bacteriophage antitermination protein Q [Escherichia coli]